MGCTSSTSPTSTTDHIYVDPVTWLKSKDADSQFVKHVECVMKGNYDPIYCHPKFDTVKSGYFRRLNAGNKIIPNEIIKICVEYLHPFCAEGNAERILKEGVNNIFTAEYTKQYILNHIEQSEVDGNEYKVNPPKCLILTVFGDFDTSPDVITNSRFDNAWIILNVLGTFKGALLYKRGCNIFIKCRSMDFTDFSKHYIEVPHGNLMIVAESDIHFEGVDIVTIGHEQKVVLNKNWNGNIYIKTNGELCMEDGAIIQSGGVYIDCNVMKCIGYNANHIKAKRGGADDLIIRRNIMKGKNINVSHQYSL